MAERRDDAYVVVLVRRMFEDGCERVSDGEALSEAGAFSDSGYLLQLLGFEVLLKAVHLARDGPPPRGHKYEELFEALPVSVQVRLARVASDRMTISADYSNLPELLATFSSSFVDLRYAYERYKGCLDVEIVERGLAWLGSGGHLSEADFCYHPEELTGLTFALAEHLQAWINGDGGGG